MKAGRKQGMIEPYMDEKGDGDVDAFKFFHSISAVDKNFIYKLY
ncbi:MAG: hypothetical protein ACMUIU_08395 [bacterium]